VHEVGHSFVLGDEYENSNGIAARNQLPAAQPELVERFENLHAHTGLQDASEPGGVDPSGIKWNHLRIKKISHVKSLARRPNNQIAVEVSRKQRRRWRKGDRAYLGASARNNLSSRQEVAGLEADAVLLQPDANLNLDDYPAGSFLIGPKQKGDDDLFLVDPAVLEHVRLNGPFPRSLPNCAQASAAKQLPPKGIANFSQPSSRWRVVGLYEGGGGFNCGTHRPSGQCRMRDSFDEAQQKHIAFCFVCRYLIVDQVDPLEHDTLDACYYPEDC
jgi:hypothetical protein